MATGILIGLALVPGLYQLLVAVVNRTQSTSLPPPLVHVIEKLHAIGLLATPPVAIWLATDQFGGTTDRTPNSLLSVVAWILIAWSLFGWFILLRNALRWQLRRLPPQVIKHDSQVIDFVRPTNGPPLGPGPHRRLARLPGNQCFQCEFRELSIVLDRVPPQWDGLKILHLSDFHFQGAVGKAYFAELIAIACERQPDITVFTGDLLDEMSLLPWTDDTLGKVHGRFGRYYVLGNHDWRTHRADDIRQRLDDLGWIDVSRNSQQLDIHGLPLEIAGDERPWMGRTPQWQSDAFRLLLGHAPDVIEQARRDRVDLMLAGHTHGGQIRLPILGPIYAPSRYGVRYASGTFWKPPTLMHVSQGVSGAQPVRYLCRPEVSLLTLRSPAANAPQATKS